MSLLETLESRRAEFEDHVWNHADDVFQQGFDSRRRLSKWEVEIIVESIDVVRGSVDDHKLANFLLQQMIKNQDSVFVFMQLVGLTRSKVISDLKGVTAGSGIRIPSTAAHLHRRPEVWSLAGPYLAKRLRAVLTPLTPASGVSLVGAIEALNQATWPGWIRQERAKRQGHEAEHRLAVLLASLEIEFQPEEKADNPLCRDAQIDGISFDLVVPHLLDPRLCFKATVHTSNIGQYGESKDALEVAEAKAKFAEMDRPPILMALIDGVGFRSNRAGLDGVLEGADEFCQFATIWKAAVLAAHSTGRLIDLVLPDVAAHQSFIDRYEAVVRVKKDAQGLPNWVNAGEALVRLSD
jgi:hypothetical protein